MLFTFVGTRHAGGITRFSLLSAAGSTAKSRIRYARVMGLKEEAVQKIGFQRLAIFRPGIIAGNVHTPGYAAWLGRLIPGPFGTIEQDDIGRRLAGKEKSLFAVGRARDVIALLAEMPFEQLSKGNVILDEEESWPAHAEALSPRSRSAGCSPVAA